MFTIYKAIQCIVILLYKVYRETPTYAELHLGPFKFHFSLLNVELLC